MKRVILGCAVLLGFLAINGVRTMSADQMQAVSGSTWCSGRLLQVGCPNPGTLNGNTVGACTELPVSVLDSCFTTSNMNVTAGDNCNTLTVELNPGVTIHCGSRATYTDAGGSCWQHIACVPLL